MIILQIKIKIIFITNDNIVNENCLYNWWHGYKYNYVYELFFKIQRESVDHLDPPSPRPWFPAMELLR